MYSNIKTVFNTHNKYYVLFAIILCIKLALKRHISSEICNKVLNLKSEIFPVFYSIVTMCLCLHMFYINLHFFQYSYMKLTC